MQALREDEAVVLPIHYQEVPHISIHVQLQTTQLCACETRNVARSVIRRLETVRFEDPMLWLRVRIGVTYLPGSNNKAGILYLGQTGIPLLADARAYGPIQELFDLTPTLAVIETSV
jgi:hypothetical protein